jgi:phosphoglycolate phosphatase-like HAD superfamily hydrolase
MLIFDFDGVLVNSLDEVTLTVYNTATGERVTSLADLPAALVGLFQRNRYHVQPIGDAILLMNWCLHHYRRTSLDILNLKEYETLISVAEDSTAERTRRFYETRKRFIEKDPECWLALHQPYQPLWDELVRRPDYPVVILTYKNRDAILRLCRDFGLNIQRIDVYSADNWASKTENMQRIRERYGARQYYFLDDSLKNLKELDAALNRQQKMLIPLLASWGYTGPEAEKLARKCGYAVLKQTDAISLLGKFMPMN